MMYVVRVCVHGRLTGVSRMDFAYLRTAIREGICCNHCVLCGTALNSYLDELPCPHWFLVPGWRGFRNRTLAPVFELFDLAQLVDYLKIAAASRHAGEQGIPWRPGEVEGSVGIAIPGAAVAGNSAMTSATSVRTAGCAASCWRSVMTRRWSTRRRSRWPATMAGFW